MPSMTMREMLHEHDTLNGFGSSLIEFVVVALIALALSGFELVHGRRAWSVAYLG